MNKFIPQLFFILLLTACSSSVQKGDEKIRITKEDILKWKASAAGMEPLNTSGDKEGTYLRIWVPQVFGWKSSVLDVEMSAENTTATWYEIRPAHEKDKLTNCEGSITQAKNEYAHFVACITNTADAAELEYLMNELQEIRVRDLLTFSTGNRVQIDGRSMEVEFVEDSEYQFVKFMHSFFREHPERERAERLVQLATHGF